MAETSNLLLNCLPADAFKLLSAHLQRVELKRGDVLFEPHSPIDHVYFFEGGLSSEIAISSGKRLEVGCIGREGFSATPVALGVDTTPHQAFMQVGGPALRIETIHFQAAIDRREGANLPPRGSAEMSAYGTLLGCRLWPG